MERAEAISKIEEKHGKVRGEELKDLFIKHYGSWGPRFLAHGNTTGDPFDNPSLCDIHDVAVKGLANSIE